jgi:hypothetical protein
MKRFVVIGWSSLIIIGAHSAGAQPERAAIVAKHQLSECMTKRMSADKNLSYNEAMRACKVRLQPPRDLASISPLETGTKGH